MKNNNPRREKRYPIRGQQQLGNRVKRSENLNRINLGFYGHSFGDCAATAVDDSAVKRYNRRLVMCALPDCFGKEKRDCNECSF